MECFQVVFMTSCRIMDYYRKNPLNFGDDPTQSDRMAAILDFHYNILHMQQVNLDMGISSELIVGLGGVCTLLSTSCFTFAADLCSC